MFDTHYYVGTERFYRNWLYIFIYLEKIRGRHVKKLYQAFYEVTHPDIIEDTEAGGGNTFYGTALFISGDSGSSATSTRVGDHRTIHTNK